jgi:hypothetical protein
MNKYIGLHHHSCTLSTLLNLRNKLGKIHPPTLSVYPWSGFQVVGTQVCAVVMPCGGSSNPSTNTVDVSVAVHFGNPSMLNQGLLRWGQIVLLSLPLSPSLPSADVQPSLTPSASQPPPPTSQQVPFLLLILLTCYVQSSSTPSASQPPPPTGQQGPVPIPSNLWDDLCVLIAAHW